MKPEDYVIVEETRTGKFTQEIHIGRHVLMADEPQSNGGDDTGPSPYEYLLVGLGSCTSMTVRYYAELKKIPLEKVIVKLKHDKIHAKDCEDCESSKAKIDHIDRKITLLGNLSPDQKTALLNVANKCPVHRTLTSTVSIETVLED